MATRIEVEYDRQFPSSEIQALIARSNVTLSVFQQLGVAYQTLPGLAMAAYQTETDALEADVSAECLGGSDSAPVDRDRCQSRAARRKEQGDSENAQRSADHRRRSPVARPNHRPDDAIRRRHTHPATNP